MTDAKYIGLDVHQATISVTVLDFAGKLVEAENLAWEYCTGNIRPTYEQASKIPPRMSVAYCCSELEKLVVKPDKEKGLGLLWIVNKRGARFILEYRQDWKIPVADDSIQISFCPYCGTKL